MPGCTVPSVRNRYRVLLALACTIGAQSFVAASISISKTQALSFGKFVAGNGSITISPAGARSATGGVITLSSDPGQAAQFMVTGDAFATYLVTLPADGTVTMDNGGNRLSVNAFTSSPAFAGVLSGGGTQLLSVGARLDVIAGKSTGAYSGSISGSVMVEVDYN